MNDRIVHRGPDDEGLYTDNGIAAMGMRRLSIIDLSTGNQPMHNETGDIVIVFNGEIYNYKVLKSELELAGVKFYTQSDTEVILRLYEKYGKSMLHKLNGMFAFSIYDKRENQVFIARDRFGEKPLYYYHNEEKFVWASELKSIISVFPELKKISTKGISLFFSLTYIPAPYSIYQDIYKLMPGHFITINTLTLEKQIQEYWDIEVTAQSKPAISYNDAKSNIYKLLSESVEQRMIADVPLGVFLSGGVDSTIVAALMASVSGKKIKTFSVGYENKRYDESARAKQVANHIGAEHYEYIINYNDIFNKVDEIVLNYDEPYADSSCLPTWFVSSKTVEHVKVALTGDGGDEVFGGYNKYMLPQYRKRTGKYIPEFLRSLLTNEIITKKLLKRGDSKSLLSKIRKISHLLNEDTISGHLNIIALGFRQPELKELFNDDIIDYKVLLQNNTQKIDKIHDELKQLRYLDKQISLEGDMLVKVDRASMLCSLECRSPFLDHRLMEYTYQLPDDYLIHNGNKKRILKDTFKHLLPTDFFNAPKSGFEIPISQWLRGPLKVELLEVLSYNSLQQSRLFNIKYVQKLIDEHLSNKADNARLLWTLLCFQKWYKANMN
jgi:asparagine synthase (glutamine-hydrolysing)